VPALVAADYAALTAAACRSCGGGCFRARAIATGSLQLLDGEPVSAVAWERPQETPPAERVYRVECTDCGAIAWERDDCPLCLSRGGLARALGGRHGLTREAGTLPVACPRCGWSDLVATVEARMHALLVFGSVSRRVADAEAHEPGFHAVALACPSCEETIAAAPSSRCAVCGRSSLLKNLRR
jgi:ssDNA-binding Zn-finger/Zn-ribbon topoisomerase 1